MQMQLTQCSKSDVAVLLRFGHRVFKEEGANGSFYEGELIPGSDGLVKQFVDRKRAVNKNSTLKLASPKISIKAGRNNDVYQAIRKLHSLKDVVARSVLEKEIEKSLPDLSHAQIRGALSMLIHRYEAIEVVKY